MPNTLIHIAIQTPLSRALAPHIAIPWILAGIIIPDVPWILQRLVMTLQLADPYLVRLYFTAQASLGLSLLLCLVLAAFSARPGTVFALLAGNALGHLLLDALEIKWGNGVHLFAPFSWQSLHVGLIWPEHALGYGAALLGIVYLAFKLPVIFREGLGARGRPRWTVASVALLLYLLSPLMFFDALERANPSFLQTIRLEGSRHGKEVELDRSYYSHEHGTVSLFTGETVAVTGALPQQSGTVSIKGQFIGSEAVHSSAYHLHNRFRDHASMLGLALSLAIWLLLLGRNSHHRLTRK